MFLSFLIFLNYHISDGYIQKFMFFQLFCFFHALLVCIGLKARIPIYFAPSQIALVRFSVCFYSTYLFKKHISADFYYKTNY